MQAYPLQVHRDVAETQVLTHIVLIFILTDLRHRSWYVSSRSCIGIAFRDTTILFELSLSQRWFVVEALATSRGRCMEVVLIVISGVFNFEVLVNGFIMYSVNKNQSS